MVIFSISKELIKQNKMKFKKLHLYIFRIITQLKKGEKWTLFLIHNPDRKNKRYFAPENVNF